MDLVIEVKLKKLLKDRGLDQKQLAKMSGLTERTISELANGKMKRYPKEVLEKIIGTLDIRDIRELIDLVPKEDIDTCN
ncbi:helix-turn-helix domain-containing protein [Bacillus chungangensis]|uniref:Transcriptional regulator n=1 Tax=Bacillus chungangensis TaxID=587633 RepID=A0ABT9WMC8_9BACI|nr:helix-turn-helix transcriptional regulator [Bacillus chungangensis]MDQ0174396.1 putative transcriptional regulator [Bacillus chungangensis]